MIRSALLCLGGSLLVATGVAAQQPGHKGDTAKGMNREMMMQRVQAADARLDRLVSEMNSTTGAKKVEAMAAVINEIVAQRKQMRAHMREMMESHDMMQGNPGEMRGPKRDSRPPGEHGQHHDSTQP